MQYALIVIQSILFALVASQAFGPATFIFWSLVVANAVFVAVYGQIKKAEK